LLHLRNDINELIDVHRRGEGEGGHLMYPPIMIFEKLPHKNAIKYDPP
jgi:hypothetical protein